MGRDYLPSCFFTSAKLCSSLLMFSGVSGTDFAAEAETFATWAFPRSRTA
jgi:hypothetical protein